MKIESRIADFIEENQLMQPQAKCLVALSGGADSVALLLLLKEHGYKLEAVHCNFHLRGEESDRDEAFCAVLCEKENIPFHRVHFDTRQYAILHKVSIEMAARELRYRYFEQLRHDIDAAVICVAHHLNDQAETVLHNLIRGAGLHGLTGMAPRNGNVVRPLLCVSREEIELYLQARHQDFVTDSSNLTDDVTRNKIRHHILPILQEINPSATEHLYKTAHYLREAEKMAYSVLPIPLKQTDSGLELSIPSVLNCPSPLYSLYYYFKRFGFGAAQIEQIAKQLSGMEPGKVFVSPTHQLLIDRERIIVEPFSKPIKALRIIETGTYVVDSSNRLCVEILDKTDGFSIDKRKEVGMFDADKVKFPLTVRVVGNGDRFFPLGMNGSKLLSDFLTDRKLTLFEKKRQLVVEDANNSIVWVVNQQPSEHHKVTDNTRRILRMELKKA